MWLTLQQGHVVRSVFMKPYTKFVQMSVFITGLLLTSMLHIVSNG